VEVPQRRITPAAGRYPPALSGRLPPRLAIDRREVANALDPAAQALLVGLAAAGRCRRHLGSGRSCPMPERAPGLLRHPGRGCDHAPCTPALAVRRPRPARLSIGAGALSSEQKKGLPGRGRVPAFLIGRLACDLMMKGEGLEELLLIDAMARLCAIEAVGRLIVIDPIDEGPGLLRPLRVGPARSGNGAAVPAYEDGPQGRWLGQRAATGARRLLDRRGSRQGSS